jgi:hypothetical protein
MKITRLLVIAAMSIVAAGPLGGFVFGFITCSDCGWNIVSRAFIGCVMAIVTPLSGGFPPQNEGGVGEPFNTWPYIITAGLFVFALLAYRDYRKQKSA